MTLPDILGRIEHVLVACGGEKQQEAAADAGASAPDPFIELRRSAQSQVLEIRSTLRDLDDTIAKVGPSAPSVVILCQRVRTMLDALRATADRLEAAATDLAKKRAARGPEGEAAVAQRAETVALVRAHHSELSEAFSAAFAARGGAVGGPAAPAVYSTAELQANREAVRRGYKSNLPEIDVDVDTALEMAREQDKVIEGKLDVLSDALTTFQTKAHAMNAAAELQTEMLAELETNMEGAHEEMKTENQRIKEQLGKVRKAESAVLDMIMIGMIVGMVVLFFI